MFGSDCTKSAVLMKPVFAYITCPDTDSAVSMGRNLVEQRLAACVNILPGMTSIYHWKGAIEQDNEVVLIAKTSTELFESLKNSVCELHPYECPCVLELPVGRGNQPYIDWLDENLGGTNG